MILFPFSLIVPLIPQQHTQERLKETREKKQLQSINAFWQPQAWTINPHGRKLWKMREKEFCLIYWASYIDVMNIAWIQSWDSNYRFAESLAP